ncbi:MAG: hypothetical protein FJW34_01400 [Acidobacteria bacterium]|nr:hypothetical protein [Acidobacteriota bacterium]
MARSARSMVFLGAVGAILLAPAQSPAYGMAVALHARLVQVIPVAGLWTLAPANADAAAVVASPAYLLALLSQPEGRAWEIIAIPGKAPGAEQVGAWPRHRVFYVSSEHRVTQGERTLRSVEATRGRLLVMLRVSATGTGNARVTSAAVRVRSLLPVPPLGEMRVRLVPRARLEDPARHVAEVEIAVPSRTGLVRVNLPADLPEATAAGMVILFDMEFARPGSYDLSIVLEGSVGQRAVSTTPAILVYRWLIGTSRMLPTVRDIN